MACSITIVSVKGFRSAANQPPNKIEVEVAFDGCPSVLVRAVVDSTETQPAVAVLQNDGRWIAKLIAGQYFEQGLFKCGKYGFRIIAWCERDKDCTDEKLFGELPCSGSSTCPDAVHLHVLDMQNHVVAEDEVECLPAGRYKVRVVEPSGSGLQFFWSVDNVTQQGQNQNEFIYDLADDGQSHIISVIVMAGQTCPPISRIIQLTVCPQQVECPEAVVLEVVNASNQVVQTDRCLPPGTYKVRLVEPSTPGLEFSWSVDNILQDGETQREFTYNLISDNRSHSISVVVNAGEGCSPLSGALQLTACPPEAKCPEAVVLEVVDASSNQVIRVDEVECLPKGSYIIRVKEPSGSGLYYSWSVDDIRQDGENGSEFTYNLVDDGRSHIISVSVTVGPRCVLSGAKELPAVCKCPSDVGLEVLDSDGNPIDPSHCVEPGTYQVIATGDGMEGANRRWEEDGRPRGDRSDIIVSLNDGATCGPPPSKTVTLSVSKSGCKEQQADVTLTMCSDNVFSPCCWLLRLLIVIFAGISFIALAIWICPDVLTNPLVDLLAANDPQDWAWLAALMHEIAAIAPIVAPGVTIAAMAIAVVLLVWWLFFSPCKPTLCNDILVLIWQMLVSLGFILLYFGSCPLCTTRLWAFGAALMALGAIAFIGWILYCRPSHCKIFFEITSLGIINSVLALLEAIFGVCLWGWGWLILLIWNLMLWLAGVVGMIIACRLNPNRRR